LSGDELLLIQFKYCLHLAWDDMLVHDFTQFAVRTIKTTNV